MPVKSCIQCGTCLNHCPVYKLKFEEQTSPKGKHVILDAVQHEHLSWKDTIHLTRMCVGCERCKKACPLHLSVPDELALARSRHSGWVKDAWKIWITFGSLLWPLASFSASACPQGLTPDFFQPMLRSARGMRKLKPSSPWCLMGQGASNKKTDGQSPKIMLFSGCTSRFVRPIWATKAKAILMNCGYEVVDAEFGCCGSTLHHAGLLEEARKCREQNIALWDKHGQPPVATFCASCHHALESYATEIEDASLAAKWKEAVTPLSSLLEDVPVRQTQEAPQSIAYHKPCHRSDNDTDAKLLRRMFPNLAHGQNNCCGMGGVLKMTHAKLSEDVARQCWKGLSPKEEGDFAVLSGCSGCVLQLSATSPKNATVWHWLDVVGI